MITYTSHLIFRILLLDSESSYYYSSDLKELKLRKSRQPTLSHGRNEEPDL